MKTYLITGATGYVGSMLIKYIAEREQEAQIIALVRDRQKAENMLPAGIQIVTADIGDEAAMKELTVSCDYLIHCAAVTKSSEMVHHPVEVYESIVNGTQNVLELARRCSVQSMVYLSNMEVYGMLDCADGHRATESELGAVNLQDVRSCYPMGKRMAESLCYYYGKEYGVPVKVAGLAQTFGRGILPEETRVFAQFARAAVEERDIVLHTKGDSIGNYCGIGDAISGILYILKRGADGEAYNVVNEENTMSIREMAELVANKVAHGKIKVVYDIPDENKYGYAATTGLRMSGSKLRALGWEPSQSLEHMYSELIADICSQ